jgi:hypothetical protein
VRPSNALLALSLVLGGCALGDRDLAAFEHTATGPDKLRAVLADMHREPSLRARAALRLLDLPRSDVNGRTLLFSELSHMTPEARAAIVPTFAEGLTARMRTADDLPPSQRAVFAKDAGVELLAMLDGEARQSLGRVLIAFLAHDVERRADVGEHPLEEVVKRVGPSGVSTLVAALRAELPIASLARLGALIDAHADAATRSFAGKTLSDVERVRGLRVDVPASEQVRLLAVLGRFRDQDAARARLVEVARDPARAEATRLEALSLMESHVADEEIDGLLALATDITAPLEVRAAAASRAGETRSRRALPGLLALLAERDHERLRRRAGELVLDMGVPESAAAFFRALPAQWDMRYSKAELDAYAERLATFPREPPLVSLLNEKLMSSMWWNRLLALRYFGARGETADLWRIHMHLDDAHVVNGEGFPKAYTVGQEAAQALAMAGERNRVGWAQQRAAMAGELAPGITAPAGTPVTQ